MQILLFILLVLLTNSNPAYCQTDTSDKKTSFNFDYGFKVTVGDEEGFGAFKTFISFELSRNGKLIFTDKSNIEYEFGNKLYPIVMQTGKDSYELLFEINDRPSKNYLKRLFVKEDRVIRTDKLPTFVSKPVDINGDGVMEYAGFWDHGQMWGENNSLTAYNPILYYSVTKNGLKLDSLLTKERNVFIYGKFHGYDFSEKIEVPASVSKAFDAEIKLLTKI